MSDPTKLKKPTEKQAKDALWRKGVLRWKLRDYQKIIYDRFYKVKHAITILMCSRQIGKTYTLCVIALEYCLKNKNITVKYVCPKKDMVKRLLKQTINQIIEDCPEDCKPEYKEADKLWLFPNGSELQMAGTDNQSYDSMRGTRSWLNIVDEAGYCSDLEIVIDSVLVPTTTTTGGVTILASTPNPDDPDHDFIRRFVTNSSSDAIHKYTLHDNTSLTEIEIQQIINRYPGGEKNHRFRAEYLCEIVRGQETMVIPEFDDDAEKEIVRQYEPPKWYDTYVSMDIGGKDFTVVLFGYYDFLKNTIVIVGEYVAKGKQNSNNIAIEVRKKITELWGEKPIYMMYADNNNVILLNDLAIYHGLSFIPTKKDNKEASINQLRNKIQSREISIDPSCTTLISHLRSATWAKSNSNGYKQFTRSVEFGHFDAVDALLYMVRNIIPSKNPYPINYNSLDSSNTYSREVKKEEHSSLSNLFKVKSSLRR